MERLTATAQERVAQVARSSYGRLLALLASQSRDIVTAEDALADAFERALTSWAASGVPENPEGWLLTVARNRQRDLWKSAAARLTEPLEPEGCRDADTVAPDGEPDEIPDKRLALLFVCAHPAIDRGARSPLMLQTVLGFRADQIARAFAVPTDAMAQRLVRAKRRIREAGIPFAVPSREAMPPRLTDVAEAIYGTYAIDWQGTAAATERDSMAGEARYLAELLADLLPDESEAQALAALVALLAARAGARFDLGGRFVPLHEQDPRQWDPALIARGEARLRWARDAVGERGAGRFQLEAAIQSVHCARAISGVTDHRALRTLYAALIRVHPTLGAQVALTAVIGEIDGADAALMCLDAIDDPRIGRFQPAWAVRAEMLARAGRDAGAAYAKAVALTTDMPTRDYLIARAAGRRPPEVGTSATDGDAGAPK